MKNVMICLLLIVFISCGSGGDGGGNNSSSATITALKSSRDSMAEVAKVAPTSSKSSGFNKYLFITPGTDLDNNNWSSTGAYDYEENDNNTYKEFFANEFDSKKAVGSGRSNLMNRLDEALLVLCAFSIDFTDALTVTTGKTMEITSTTVNDRCGTKLHPEQISFTGGTGVVEDVSGVSGSQYERKITITDNEGDSVYYLTNNDTTLKYAFGATDSESNERVFYTLTKSTGDFTFEYIQGSKDSGNYPYHYRAIKSGANLSVVGRVSHGDGVNYFLTLDKDQNRATLDFIIGPGDQNDARSVCIDTSMGSVASGGFASCFTGQAAEEYTSFSTFFGIDLFSSTAYTDIDETSVINFSNVAGMNSGL